MEGFRKMRTLSTWVDPLNSVIKADEKEEAIDFIETEEQLEKTMIFKDDTRNDETIEVRTEDLPTKTDDSPINHDSETADIAILFS